MKNLIIQISDELHKKIKLEATKNGMSIKDYVMEKLK